MTQPDKTEPVDLDPTTMSGETEPKPERDYLVRLLFRIPADTPEQAVERYLEQIMSHGLRNWSYRVEDEETGEFTTVNGYGEIVDNGRVVEVEADDNQAGD